MDYTKCWYEKVCKSDCSPHCIRFMEMNYLMQHSGLPEKKQIPVQLKPVSVDINAFDRLLDIKEDIVNYVNNGNNLYITSKYCGNGKTSWAIKLLLRYFDEIWAGNGFKVRGLFIHVPTFFMRMKNNISDRDESFIELRESINDADIVVWDEVANATMTKYEMEQLLSYIDYRLLAGKCNIYTSNIVDLQEVQRIAGVKLASRVYNASEVIELKGKDRRTNES